MLDVMGLSWLVQLLEILAPTHSHVSYTQETKQTFLPIFTRKYSNDVVISNLIVSNTIISAIIMMHAPPSSKLRAPTPSPWPQSSMTHSDLRNAKYGQWSLNNLATYTCIQFSSLSPLKDIHYMDG